MYFVEQKYKRNGIENRKIHSFRETNLGKCFGSYKNRKLKVKLWWVGGRENKKGHLLYRLFCSNEIFLKCVFYLNV